MLVYQRVISKNYLKVMVKIQNPLKFMALETHLGEFLDETNGLHVVLKYSEDFQVPFKAFWGWIKLPMKYIELA